MTASAATLHVWPDSPSPAPPFTDWATAAHAIQDAVDAAQPSDMVLVTNGVYATGGRAVVGTMTNRVVIDKAITVQSVNGPEATLIVGAPAPGGTNGDGAIRCAYVGENAVLSGFTLTNGYTLRREGLIDPRVSSGGGAWCEPTGVMTNCLVKGNSADGDGGGVYGGVLYMCVLARNSSVSDDGGGVDQASLFNCTLLQNTAWDDGGGADDSVLYNCVLIGNSTRGEGGAAYESVLYNCTVTFNEARKGGGLNKCSAWNCILYYNRAPYGANYLRTSVALSCTTPLPLDGSGGNISAEPQFASRTHLAATSPCIGAGSAVYALGVDMDGEPWQDPPSMGADEYLPGGATSALSVAIGVPLTNAAVGFPIAFQPRIEGQVTRHEWDFGDGTRGTNSLQVDHAWSVPGTYPVRLTAFNDAHPGGLSTTITVQVVEQPVYYVNASNLNPMPPYQSWDSAATNIQDAVGAATLPGRLVLVTDGVYATGGVAVWGLMTNRVALTNAVVVRSVNGPAVTVIQGAAAPGNSVGDGAIRCAFLDRYSVLSGFTLTNGHTRASGDTDREQSGGGVWCETGGMITNCVLTGNAVAQDGGGAEHAALRNCTLIGNTARDDGGGAEHSLLQDCVLIGNEALGSGGAADESIFYGCGLTNNRASSGGGVEDSTLYHCTLAGNTATSAGGAASEAMLFSSLLTGNSAASGGAVFGAMVFNSVLTSNSATWGGGSYQSTLYNCTLINNSASSIGGGMIASPYFPPAVNNCIIYYNTAPASPNYETNSILNFSCTFPLPPAGTGNLTNEPAFLDLAAGNLRLQSNSPCINAGNNADASGVTDLDGRPRIVGGTVDMGAYEFQGLGMGEFIGWLHQHGLPTDGSADTTDSDADHMNNWQEWRCGTDPNNALSVLRLLPPSRAGSEVNVSWQSVAGVSYFLERSTNLGASPPFQSLATNLTGQAGTTTFTDTNAPAATPRFYRVVIP